MQRARLSGIPFWPATSVLDMPSIIFTWQSIAAEAEAKARTELDRINAKRAALANTQPTPVRRIS